MAGVFRAVSVGGRIVAPKIIPQIKKMIGRDPTVSKTLEYKPSSGVKLEAEPGRTTTVIGAFKPDMEKIIKELGNVKSTEFGPRNGGFNVLNAPDDCNRPQTPT